MVSYKEFVLAYENGSLGCGVSALQTLRLFFAGNIREKKVSINLFLRSLSFLALIIASVIAFLKFPVLWALLGTIAIAGGLRTRVFLLDRRGRPVSCAGKRRIL